MIVTNLYKYNYDELCNLLTKNNFIDGLNLNLKIIKKLNSKEFNIILKKINLIKINIFIIYINV